MFKKVISVGLTGALGLVTAVTTLGQTPAQPPTQTPAQTPVQTPAQTPAQTPTQTPAQTPQTTVIKQDDRYTIIEYPGGKEVKVTLNPVGIKGATGLATILRDDDGTRVQLNVSGVPQEVTTLNVYAIDPSGTVTSLGPVTLTKGLGTLTTTTPLNRFMIILSPEASLTAYGTDTPVIFRSAVPQGFAVIPHSTQPVGERVGATTTPGTTVYEVPMLNIPAYEKGDDTKISVNFTGELSGAKANVHITPRTDGPTEVQMEFDDLKQAPAGKVFTLWAVSPDQKYIKLGQIVSAAGRDEAEIKSEIELKDFGLLITMEDASAMAGTVLMPVGPSVGVVHIIR